MGRRGVPDTGTHSGGNEARFKQPGFQGGRDFLLSTCPPPHDELFRNSKGGESERFTAFSTCPRPLTQTTHPGIIPQIKILKLKNTLHHPRIVEIPTISECADKTQAVKKSNTLHL